MAEDTSIQAFAKSHCNTCGGERNHYVLHCEQVACSEQVDDNFSIDWLDLYEFLKCRGCESVSTRKTTRYPGTEDIISYFPPAISRREPRWLYLIPWPSEFDCHPVTELFKEIYIALHNDSRRLAAMGIRAVLDCVMSEKVGDGSFDQKLKASHDAGYVSRLEKDNLKAIIEAGHASTHRSWNPSRNDLEILLEITESFVERMYFHESKARQVTCNVPKRIKKNEDGLS